MTIKANWPPPDSYYEKGSLKEMRMGAAKKLRCQLEEYLKHKRGNPDLQEVVDGLLHDLLDGENVLWELYPERKPGKPSEGPDREFAIVEEMNRLRLSGKSKADAKALLITAMKEVGEGAGKEKPDEALSKQIDRALLNWQSHMPLEDDPN